MRGPVDGPEGWLKMKYSRFEELPVWQAAIELALKTYDFTDKLRFRGRAGLRNQLERAVLSISNNIAEGFERGTTKELLTFLYISRGSAGEVRSMLCLMEHFSASDHFKSEISNLKSRVESISRQLRGWVDALQNSDIKGQRYLNDSSRRATQSKREKSDYADEFRRIQMENIERTRKKRASVD